MACSFRHDPARYLAALTADERDAAQQFWRQFERECQEFPLWMSPEVAAVYAHDIQERFPDLWRPNVREYMESQR